MGDLTRFIAINLQILHSVVEDSDDMSDLITINIQIFHSVTHTLRVKKTIFVFELKQEIPKLNRWLEQPLRLIFRGRALKDGFRLSDYHVEEGQTLYLVGRPEIQRFSSNAGLYRNSNLGPVPVIPDSITTLLSGRLNRLRQLFAAYGQSEQSERSMDNLIKRACRWMALVHTTRQMLIAEVAEYLTNISKLLVYLSTQVREQESMAELGSYLCDLGRAILAFGHAISRTSSGETQLRYYWLVTEIEDGRVTVNFIRYQQDADDTNLLEQCTEEEIFYSDADSDNMQIVI